MNHGLKDYCQSYKNAGHLDIMLASRKDQVAALHIWSDDHIPAPKSTDMKYDVIRKVIAKAKNPKVATVLQAAEKSVAVWISYQAVMSGQEKWHKERVILVGDAADCLSVITIQGAGVGMASVEILEEELGGESEIEEALENKEKRVWPSIRAAAPKLTPKNRLVSLLRPLFTKALCNYIYGAMQAVVIVNEVSLANLEELRAAVATVSELIARSEVEGKEWAERAKGG